ncbi:MAG: alpha/beta fold hydrolase [Vicinamibacteria bacterium]
MNVPSLSSFARAVSAAALLLAAADAASAQPLRFAPCPENASLDCATLEVPVDYDVADGKSVGLAVVRARAADPAQRIGVLFTHPGGHGSGVDFVLSGVGAPAFEAMRARFDIVSIDPRGAGRSRPLHCPLTLPPPPPDDSDPAQIAYLDGLARAVARGCLGQGRAFVTSISGMNFARDLESLRMALGEEQLSLAMISNSGPVGAMYASAWPQRVRAMVIDSTVAPDFEDYLIERPSEQQASYELALQRLDQLCATIPGCPLADEGVVKTFDRLKARLALAPVPGPGGPFGPEDFAATFSTILPIEGLWAPAIDGLRRAVDGDFGFFFLFPSGGDTNFGFLARACNDYSTRRGAADFLPVTRAVGNAYPRFFGGPAWMGQWAARCGAWPAAETPVIRNLAGELAVPVLLIGSEFDSDAPFPWTKRMAKALGMERHVVRYQGGGHGLVTKNQSCFAPILADYMFDLRLPREGTTCAAEPPVTAVHPADARVTSEVAARPLGR